MDIQLSSVSRLNAILKKLSYRTTLVTEVSKTGLVDNFLKIVLSIEDLRFSNWFNFKTKEMLLAESDSKHIVTLNGNQFLKVYTVKVEKPRNEHEKKYGRKYINITKGHYIDGLCYYVKKEYPRPKFLPTTYKVNFSSLNWISKEIKLAVNKNDDTINSSMIEISFQVVNENLIAVLRIN